MPTKSEKFKNQDLASQQPDLTSKLNLLKEKIIKGASETKDRVQKFQDSPTPESASSAMTVINQDYNLTDSEKIDLVKDIRDILFSKYDFSVCPDDYQSLKKEAKVLAGVNQYSFILMAQRLTKIRDEKLYLEEYPDFISMINSELPIAKRTVYAYINLLECFGVQTFALESEFEYTKLLPVIPLIKSDNEKIPKEDIKKHFIGEVKEKSAREMKDEADKLKVKYGIAKKKDEINKYDRELDRLLAELKDNPEHYDRERLKFVMKEISIVLKRGN